MLRDNILRIGLIIVFVILALLSVYLDYWSLVIDDAPFWLYITALLISVGPELAGISIGFVTIDFLNERRLDKLEIAQTKSQLIREMGSQSNDFASRAIHELKYHGWLIDGSLKGKGFGSAHLEKTILKNANLEETDFVGTNLKDADLTDANFKSANLKEVKMNSCKLSGCDFEEANLLSANMNKVQAMKANFKGAKLVGAMMKGGDFSETGFQNADLNGATLVGSQFSNADLTKANLSGADLRYADFSGADLTGVDLSGAIMDQAVIDLEQLKSVVSLESVDHQEPYLRLQIEQQEEYVNLQQKNTPEEEWFEHQVEEQERYDLMNRNLSEAKKYLSQKETRESDS